MHIIIKPNYMFYKLDFNQFESELFGWAVHQSVSNYAVSAMHAMTRTQIIAALKIWHIRGNFLRFAVLFFI